jgi:hypothetical protein
MEFTGKRNCINAARNNRGLFTEVLANVRNDSLITASCIVRKNYDVGSEFVSAGYLTDTATIYGLESLLSKDVFIRKFYNAKAEYNDRLKKVSYYNINSDETWSSKDMVNLFCDEKENGITDKDSFNAWLNDKIYSEQFEKIEY